MSSVAGFRDSKNCCSEECNEQRMEENMEIKGQLGLFYELRT